MGKSETQRFQHGNYLEMAAFPLQETRGNVLISCRELFAIMASNSAFDLNRAAVWLFGPL